MNIQARFDLETADDMLAPQIKEDRLLRGGVRAMQIARTGYLAGAYPV
jgi:hypothetical protein